MAAIHVLPVLDLFSSDWQIAIALGLRFLVCLLLAMLILRPFFLRKA